MVTRLVEKSGTPDQTGNCKNVSIVTFSAEARKLVQQFIKDPEITNNAAKAPLHSHPIVEVAPNHQVHIKPQIAATSSIPKPAPQPAPMVDIPPDPWAVPASVIPASSGTDFKWDPDASAPAITLADDNRSCFLMEGGYCFRTAVGNVGFTGGVQYWEIHADSRTENELKIGIACKKNFNLNTVSNPFNDYIRHFATTSMAGDIMDSDN